MFVRKAIGIETEYGIKLLSPKREDLPLMGRLGRSLVSDGYLATFVVSAYERLNTDLRADWDPASETPERDIFGRVDRERHGGDHFGGSVMENGGRFYQDLTHPEHSTPECSDPYQAVIWDKAGEIVVDNCRKYVESEHANLGVKILILKNNTDMKGMSYGCHENILIKRSIDANRLIRSIVPFFASRLVIAGAGKYGTEPGLPVCGYQLSQRADFIQSVISLETMNHRPIVNLRDEPHADANLYRRLHIIIGDSNMSEWSTYLKVGAFALVAELLDQDALPPGAVPELSNPVEAVHVFSRDPSLQARVTLTNGRTVTALDIQEMYLDLCENFFSNKLTDDDAEYRRVLESWRSAVDDLKENPRHPVWVRRLDWMIKLGLLEMKADKLGVDLSSDPFVDPRTSPLQQIDLKYHEISRETSLYYVLKRRGRVDGLVDSESLISHALTNPPETTRAYFRGRVLKKFRPAQAKWGSLLFVVEYWRCEKCGAVFPEVKPAKCQCGSKKFKHNSAGFRVPMDEPLRGTKALVGGILDAAKTPFELLMLIDPNTLDNLMAHEQPRR